MKRALVTGCNLKFLPGAVGLLRSVKQVHPEVARYCLVPPSEVEAVRSGLGTLAEVLPPPRAVRGVPDAPLLQLLAARTFITSFPADVVAWIDCDVAFCRPAPELWDVPPGRVNAVEDVYDLGMMVPSDVWDSFAKRFPGVHKDQPGFNAGIYALRSAERRDLPERYEAIVAPGNFPYYPPGVDQPVLNGLFHEHVHWLPRRFNCLAIYEHGIPTDVRIIHYTASPKPWMPGYGAHNPGYREWMQYGEQCGPVLAAFLRAYYVLAGPRRFGYRAVRKALTIAGLWREERGVASGPGPGTCGSGTQA